jgi:hypothetical protein
LPEEEIAALVRAEHQTPPFQRVTPSPRAIGVDAAL